MTNKKFDILIIGGFGHVGLPFGIALADAGLKTSLYDIDKSKEASVKAGKMPFLEYDAEPVLQRVIGKSLHISQSLEDVAKAKTIIITIGTPLDEYLNPQLMPMLNLAENILPYLDSDHHIMLRSTVFPGTSKRLFDYFKDNGKPIHLSFCPERIAQGYAIRELNKLPHIVSGFTKNAVEVSKSIFNKLGDKLIELEVLEAELAKLFSNSWRYIQFSIANQFYMMAKQSNADFYRIHHAMTYGYERAQDFPKAGFAAGPCLHKDTMQLSAFYQNNFQLGHSAMLVNEGLPGFIVNELLKSGDITKTTVGILGMSFKADVDDIRDSLSYKLGKLLRFHGAEVLYSDEFVKDSTFISKEDIVDMSSVIVLGVPHSAYKKLAIPKEKQVIDVWGFFNRD